MKIVGEKDNGKPLLGPIEKESDRSMEKYTDILGEINFEGLSGQAQ